jgi:hypothetical protein
MGSGTGSRGWKRWAGAFGGAALILGVVVDATTAMGWIGVGPEADDPTPPAPTGEAVSAPDQEGEEPRPEGTEDEWFTEQAWEEAESEWVEQYSGLSMVLENGDGCDRRLFDFDDEDMAPEVWYETAPDAWDPPGYTDLVWDPCGEDYGSEDAGIAHLYTPEGVDGWLFYAGGDPTVDDCYEALRDNPYPLSWPFDPWNAEDYDMEASAVLCVETTSGALAMSVFDAVSPEDEDSWLRADLTATLHLEN